MTDNKITDAETNLRDQGLSGEIPDEGTAKLAEAIINHESNDEPAESADASEKPEAHDDDPAIAKVRKEAAGYRRKLRETEAERDSLKSRTEALERREVERRVTDSVNALADGSDLWTAGVTLDELRDDEGSIDSEKVDAARERVLAARPRWKRQPVPDFDAGARSSAPLPGPDFAKRLRDAAGG